LPGGIGALSATGEALNEQGQSLYSSLRGINTNVYV
jgi:hypothetical protein